MKTESSHEFKKLEHLALNPDDTISIKGEQISLGDIVQALVDYEDEWLQEWFDERGQLELGRYLYQQLFADTPADKNVEIRIISDDEHISRLPWLLMVHNGIFLSMNGWSVALSHHDNCHDYELPPSPRILIVAPEPEDIAETGAAQHIKELTLLLSSEDSTYRPIVVTTWNDFKAALKKDKPHVLYYYGHGVGDMNHSDLIFADEDNQRLDKPAADLWSLLKDNPPHIAYINCCYGDAGGSLGIGKQLSHIIPVVVTNRTVALIEAAQTQALAFWKSVLLEGIAPHQAVSDVRGHMAELNLSVKDIRWLTPVLHCHYANWRSNPPDRFTDWQRDPHWRLRLDRVEQFGTVLYGTGEMLRNQKPKALSYLWYGTEDQGVEVFHQRLKIELNQKLINTVVYEVLPDWEPDDLNKNFHECCQTMLCRAFAINSLDYLPAKIREINSRSSAQQTLIYIHHAPITFKFKPITAFHPKYVADYLEWWDTYFVSKLPNQSYALLGLSYQVEEPARFYNGLIKKYKLDTLDLPDTLFRLLNELEKVTKNDLLRFLKEHNIPLPSHLDKHRKMDEILDKTQGSYEKVLDEMQKLESQVWQPAVKENEDEDNRD